MSGQRHVSEAQCPTCGHDEAIVRVRGNAFSAVCARCRRVDVSPLLGEIDLVLTEGETMEAELFELEAVRSGCANGLTVQHTIVDELALLPPTMSVELRLPVPPR